MQEYLNFADKESFTPPEVPGTPGYELAHSYRRIKIESAGMRLEDKTRRLFAKAEAKKAKAKDKKSKAKYNTIDDKTRVLLAKAEWKRLSMEKILKERRAIRVQLHGVTQRCDRHMQSASLLKTKVDIIEKTTEHWRARFAALSKKLLNAQAEMKLLKDK